MKKKQTTFYVIAVVLITVMFVLAGCSDSDDTPPANSVPVVSGPIVISGTLGGGAARSITTDGIKFSGEVQDNNSIIGKLEQGDFIFNLKGQYDPATKAFTMQATSSVMVFSLSGKLNNSNNIDTSKSKATLEVKDGSGEWITYDYNIASSSQEIGGAVTETPASPTPLWSRGVWYDQMTGYKIVVTENSITVIDDDDDLIPFTIVEITENGDNAKLLTRASLIGSDPLLAYTAIFYVANSFDATLSDAIGSVTMDDIYGPGNGTMTVSDILGMLPDTEAMFVSPYCSTSNVITSESWLMSGSYSPMLNGASATANATTAGNNASNIKAIPTFTMALMRTPLF